jgi:hypothetical protein
MIVLELILIFITTFISSQLIVFGIRAVVVSVLVEAYRDDKRKVARLVLKATLMFTVSIMILLQMVIIIKLWGI